MSPVTAALNSLNRAVASFHPNAMPVLSRAHYRLELVAWIFLPVMLGAVEGGVTGVIAKNAFEGTVSNRVLNVVVAVLSAAPAFANILSLVWASIANGRHKVRFMVGLQIVTAVFVAIIALAPRSEIGLAVLVLGAVGARVCWSGVVTVRSTVWRVNYPRSDRATMAGKLATVQAIVLTIVGLGIGVAMDHDVMAYRIIYPVAAAVGLIGTWFYGHLRVRGHRALVRAEREGNDISPGGLVRTLLRHKAFMQYMACMFVFGTGNIMVAAPLVIMLRDRFGLGILASILITAVIPTILMPVTIPLWSRLLNGNHIIRFRAVHSWAFVGAITMFLLGALLDQPWLLGLGAAGKGIAYGGGVLGWNLGHHDFAPRHLASQFMGVHVTLTGVRGIIAPVAAVSIYELLEWSSPGAGPWVFAVSLALSLTGAIWFNVWARRLPKA